MRYLPYPQSCSARTIVEFGNTRIGFGEEPTSVPEMEKFLKETRKCMKADKATFCTAVLNNDQTKLFHQTMLDHGFACIQRDRLHPNYGRSVSFYLLTLDWGPNKSYDDLQPGDGEVYAVAP